jgi:hypothetical protein
MLAQCLRFSPRFAVMVDEDAAQRLAQMLRSMHLIVNTVEEAFDQEGGAYGSHHGGSGHSHDHDHDHHHGHDH